MACNEEHEWTTHFSNGLDEHPDSYYNAIYFPFGYLRTPRFLFVFHLFLVYTTFYFVRHDTRPTSHGRRAALEHVPRVYSALNAFSSISIALSSISFSLYTSDLFPGHKKCDRQTVGTGEGARPFLFSTL